MKQRRAVFVSDVHLLPGDNSLTDQFVRFLEEVVAHTDALYILGDLFEYWLGPRHAGLSDYTRVLGALKRLSDKGVEVCFVGGNRDFLFDAKTAASYGVNVLADGHVVELNGSRVMLLHGDSLCINDVRYQRMKKIIRSAPVRWFVKWLPLFFVKRLAARLRSASKREVGAKSYEEMGIVDTEVLRCFERGADVVVCGHVHSPRDERFRTTAGEKRLLVMSDWTASAHVVYSAGGELALECRRLDAPRDIETHRSFAPGE